jgi:formamidopyrimidine-DNA glycosylase
VYFSQIFRAIADLTHLVARIVHYMKKSLVGKTLATVKAIDDTNVFGKVGTSGAEFQDALTGKKVLDTGRQGKYFWQEIRLILLFYLTNLLKGLSCLRPHIRSFIWE